MRFLEGEGQDASELDEAVADYMVQLASEGGTEEEVWSVMEGAYPELEEVSNSNGISPSLSLWKHQYCMYNGIPLPT